MLGCGEGQGRTRISFSMGNGRKVRFCKDKWCGNSPLCASFPF